MKREEASARIKYLRDQYRRQITEYQKQRELIPVDATIPYIWALDVALTALSGPTREIVEKVWFREPYTRLETWDREDGATVYSARNTCMTCGQETPIGNFCHNCGAALTDEAVDMMLERWKEALENA